MKNAFSFFSIFCAGLLTACASSSSERHSAEVSPVVESGRDSSAINGNSLPFSIHSLSEGREIRRVAVKDSTQLPTLAALDFAAYFKNPIREAGKNELPENAKPVSLAFSEYPFPMLDSLLESEPEFLKLAEPLAYEPFTKFLYAKGVRDSLGKILRSVESVKWGEKNVFADFQKVEKLYLIGEEENKSWWVEVHPRTWTSAHNFWAKVRANPSAEEVEAYRVYTSETLSNEAVFDWVRTLAAYWYPTYNTDLEANVSANDWNERSPFAVMRGNPMGTPLWVAFEVPSVKRQEALLEDASNLLQAGTKSLDADSSWRISALENLQDVCPETEKTKEFQAKLSHLLDSLPSEQNAWSSNGMLWFRRNANSLLTNDFTAQDSLHNPLPRLLELKKFLDSLEIQFLVVPIPTKEAIYADKLVSETADTLCVDVAGRNFIRKLLAQGIDVLDVFPALRNARLADDSSAFSFQKFDTHWASPGFLSAMEELANKVTSYAWYESSGATPGTLEIRDTAIVREGDLIQQLPLAEQGVYAPETLEVKKVYRNGKPYSGGKNSPILLMGDSFTGVFESVDGKSGGPASLLAFATGLDVQVMTSWGGGPGVRHRMVKDKKSLKSKRLVIYMMTMRDFWQSPMEWDAL